MGDDLRNLGKYIKLVFVVYILLIAVGMVMSAGLHYFGIEQPKNTIERNGFITEIVSNYALGTFIMLFSAVFEEFLFRLVPFCVAAFIFRNDKVIVASGIVSSVLFGLIHGGELYTYMAGLIGLILYLEFYLAWKVESDPAKASMVTTASHFMYNMTVLIFAYWI